MRSIVHRCYEFTHDAECLCSKRQCIPDENDCTKGRWNETAPVCERITCPAITTPLANGHILEESNTCEGKIRYECDVGYEWTGGDLERQCTVQKTWTGKHPTCTNEVDYGTVVQFKCDHCYEFNSSATDEHIKDVETHFPRFNWLGCEATGNWNGSAPTCRRKTCPTPQSIRNGEMAEGASFLCGEGVTYTCNEGYEFLEDRTASSIFVKCGGSSWEREFPECAPVDCGDVVTVPPAKAERDLSKNSELSINLSLTEICPCVCEIPLFNRCTEGV
eukprot:sb/3468046/